MGIGGGLAGDGAQAEAFTLVESGGAQAAIVKDEGFGLGMLDKELAVIGTFEGFGDKLQGFFIAEGLQVIMGSFFHAP